MRQKKRRVQYLTHKRMQLSFTAVAIFFALFIGFLVYVTIWPVASAFIPKNLIYLVKHQILVRTLLFLIPAVFVIAGFAIVFSHRVAGPLYRIQRTIDAVVRGEDVPRLELRRKDDPELKDLANKINDLFALIKDLRISKAENSPSANS